MVDDLRAAPADRAPEALPPWLGESERTRVAAVWGAVAGSPALYADGDPVVVASSSERASLGLHTWTDGTMGFAERAGVRYGFAANGHRTARTVVLGDDVLQRPISEIAIVGHDSDYASFGPVHLTDSGSLLAFVHHEIHDHHRFWSRIGMARSDDWWTSTPTFHHLGFIVEPNLRADANRRAGAVDVGSGAFAIVAVGGVDHFYVWFRDFLDDGVTAVSLAVARAPVTDVLAAAARGGVVEWRKHHAGDWTEPGLGGRCTDLLPRTVDAGWFDVAFVEPLGQLVMVCSDYSEHGRTLSTFSRDGVSWTVPAPAEPAASGDELFYVTVVPDDVARRTIHRDVVEVLRTRSSSGGFDRWSDASVERIELRPVTGTSHLDGAVRSRAVRFAALGVTDPTAGDWDPTAADPSDPVLVGVGVWTLAGLPPGCALLVSTGPHAGVWYTTGGGPLVPAIPQMQPYVHGTHPRGDEPCYVLMGHGSSRERPRPEWWGWATTAADPDRRLEPMGDGYEPLDGGYLASCDERPRSVRAAIDALDAAVGRLLER